MINSINETFCDYNENILTQDFTFDNNLPWHFTVGAGIVGAICESSTEQHYVGKKALKIFNPSYDLNDITVRPLNNTDYSFTVPRSGKYIFSIRTFLDAQAPWLPELVGDISLYVNGGGAPFITFPLTIGNNNQPEFLYQYKKWHTFYNNVQLIGGDVMTMSIHIINAPTFTAGQFKLYLDGFKMEYITDKNYIVPTYYTKPQI